MARAVGWVLGTIAQWAQAHGLSLRTARRRAAGGGIDGAVKTGKGWIIPLRTSEYARGAGVSERTARRRVVAKATLPTDPTVTAHMPSNLPLKGSVKHVTEGRFAARDIWPWQYQGRAWLRFIRSGDTIIWYTGIIVSKIELTAGDLRKRIIAAVRDKFSGGSPVEILRVGLVYARHAV
jgi:hypothetical protein